MATSSDTIEDIFNRHTAEGGPAPAPEKPGLLGRIGAMFGRQRETAISTYRRLLKRSEIDGKPLTDKETAELFAAMKDADITEEQLAAHKAICDRYNNTRENTLKAAKTKQENADTFAALQAFEQGEYAAALKRLNELNERYRDAAMAMISVNGLEGNAQAAEADYNKLFGIVTA